MTVRLSTSEKRLLGYVTLRGNHSAAQLSAATRLSERQVHYGLRSLIEKKIIHRTVLVNPYAIGFQSFGIWMSLTSAAVGVRKKFLQCLLNSKSVSYVGEFGGEYEYKVDIMARNSLECALAIDKLAGSFGGMLQERTITIKLTVRNFNFKRFAPPTLKQESLEWTPTAMIFELDEIDQKLLSTLASIGDRTSSQISRDIGIPASNVAYRIQRLSHAGVVYGCASRIDYSLIGLSHAIHRVTMRNFDTTARDKVRRFCAQHPEVITVVELLGPWDFEINAIHDSVADERILRQELLEKLGDVIAKVRSESNFCVYKGTGYPFKNDTASLLA